MNKLNSWPSEWSREPSPHAEWVRAADLAALALPRPIVLMNGCYDILHTGHLQLLAAATRATSHGGSVVLALDSDERIRSSKGPGRPVLNWVQRATQLAWTRSVHYLVEIRTDQDFLMLWTAIQPDLRVRGQTYQGKPSRLGETPTLWVPDLTGLSTSKIAAKLLASAALGANHRA